MHFEFATATQIIFGSGSLQQVGPLAAGLGSRALVVTGGSLRFTQPLLDVLDAGHVPYTLFEIMSEPSVDRVLEGVAQVRRDGCDLVISLGGGSAIDAGKAIAALVTNPGDPLDYLEVIGKGRALQRPPLPFIAIPTTAGTGAEVTRNAVLASSAHRVKVSLRSPLMLPRVALVDPALTRSLPPEVTASTGMDALTQVIEPYVCNVPNPLVDALCREAIGRGARALRRAYEQPDDLAAREEMAVVSLFGGLALANAKLGAVHGFAGPLGGMYPIPHGVACACLLPYVMEANVRALQARQPDADALRRYGDIARLVTGRADATLADGLAWAHELAAALQIPRLSAYGVQREHFPEIVDKSARASSMKGNPITLTPDELTAILEQAL